MGFDPRYMQPQGHHVGNWDLVGYEDLIGAVPAAVQVQQGTPVQQGFGGWALPAPPGYRNQGGVMVPITNVPPQVGIPVPIPGGKGSMLVDRTQNGVIRRQLLGFGSQSVGAGATVTYNAQPQRTIRLEKLVLSASATGLLLVGLNIGADPQFVNVGSGVPVEMFAATALENLLRTVTANLGHVVSLQVQNPTAGAITMSAGAIGEAVD